MEESDRILLDRLVHEGDTQAFAAIMSQYASMVYGTGRRVLGNDAQAADVTQETFFDFLKNAHSITGSVGSWLHRVATRRAIDLVRQNVSRRRREQVYATGAWRPTDSWEEVAPQVDEALEELPEDLQRLLVQHYLERQSMTDIAAALDISQPTVSRRIAAALEHLRQNLRARGVVVGLTFLGAMLTDNVQAVPATLLQSLGKITLAQAAATIPLIATSTASPWTITGAKAALAAAALILTVGTGALLVQRSSSARRLATAQPVATAVQTIEASTPKPPADSVPDESTNLAAIQTLISNDVAPPIISGPIISAGGVALGTNSAPFGVRAAVQGNTSLGTGGGSMGGSAGGSAQTGPMTKMPGFVAGPPAAGLGPGGPPTILPGWQLPSPRAGYPSRPFPSSPPGMAGGRYSVGGEGGYSSASGNVSMRMGGSFSGGMSGGVGGAFAGQAVGWPGATMTVTNFGFNRTMTYSNGVVYETQTVFSSGSPVGPPFGRR